MITRSVTRPIVRSVAHGLGGKYGDGLPRLQAGEYFLTDENGNYLTDENGNYLTGKDE